MSHMLAGRWAETLTRLPSRARALTVAACLAGLGVAACGGNSTAIDGAPPASGASDATLASGAVPVDPSSGASPAVPASDSGGGSADTLQSTVDGIARPFATAQTLPSIIVAVSRGGVRRYFTYGEDANAPITSDTLVEIGSITKTFTTALFAEALADGTMTRSGTTQAYFPDVALSRCAAEVNLIEMADFRSGLASDPIPVDFADPQPSDIAHWPVARFVGWFAAYKKKLPASEPCGLPAPYHYSNASVGLLGLAIANAYGGEWDALVGERITAVLGMNDTVAVVTDTQRSRFATGHSDKGVAVPHWPRFAWFAAGTLKSTATDMLRYGEAALGHATVDGRPVPAALRDAFAVAQTPLYKPVDVGFHQAMAWVTQPLDSAAPQGPLLAYKDGGTNGFNSVIVTDRTHDTAVFVVTNQVNTGIQRIGLEVARALATAGG